MGRTTNIADDVFNRPNGSKKCSLAIWSLTAGARYEPQPGRPHRHAETDEMISVFYKNFYHVLDTMFLAIIRRYDPEPGLASHMITNLGQIAESISEGYIPVIDMVDTGNYFSDLSRTLGCNVWEAFFCQPFGGQSPPDLAACRHTVKEGIPSLIPDYDMDLFTNPDLTERWRLLLKTYMPFSPKAAAYIRSTLQNSLFNTGERILGVLCRGTDHTSLQPCGHPVQPTLKEILAKAEEVMASCDCRYIYLATESADIKAVFKERFQNTLFFTQDIYYPEPEGGTLYNFNKKHNIDLYKKNMEYLTALYLLSQCHCFIGGRTSGTVISFLFAGHFDYFYVWNKGRYGMDDRFFPLF